MLRRLFDIVASTLGLVVLCPLFLALGAAIKLGSQGPVFYRGKRVGRFGRPFRIFKFRTMVVNAESLGGPSTSDTDWRITRVGRFMRKYKLDELPQLLNVVWGDMSLVGPRPQVPDYVTRYSERENQVFLVRPGITDWASIWNSDEGAILAQHADPDRGYDELIHPTKMTLQLLYVDHHNLWVDLKILLYTVYALIHRDWLPRELRAIPRPGYKLVAGYETVTELPGVPANSEQLAMLYTRYGWAGDAADGKDVLEVACGSGIGLGHLASRARRIVGCDCDPKLVDIAKGHYGDRVELRQADAHSLPFPDASFDVVLLFEAIYYLRQPEEFLREAHRVLRPDGVLLVCSANCERPNFNRSPYSVRYLAANQLRELFAANGFDVQLFAGFPVKPAGRTGQVLDTIRTAAVRLGLIPKTMKWKARIKTLLYGRLQQLPSTLGRELPPPEPLVKVDCKQVVGGYKVLYANGRRQAIHQRAAA